VGAPAAVVKWVICEFINSLWLFWLLIFIARFEEALSTTIEGSVALAS
jgi:hypothetical protein